MSAITSISKMLAVLLVLLVPMCVTFGQHHAHQEHASPQEVANKPVDTPVGKPGRIEMYKASFEIPEALLINQDGKQVRLYSDLVKGKVALINFFFTSCTFVCPMQGRALSKLKERLERRVGRDVFFVSISKDPKNDTPERLKQWGKTYGAGRGWSLLTGEPAVISKLLWDFSGDKIGQEMHESMVLIGNDKTGVWTTADGLLLPDDLLRVIDKISRP